MSKIKKISVALIAMFVMVFASGCGVNVSLYYESDNLFTYYTFVTDVDSTTVSLVNNYGKSMPKSGKWTVEKYLTQLGEVAAGAEGYQGGFLNDGTYRSYISISYLTSDLRAGSSDSDEAETEEVNSDYSIEEKYGFFMHTYNVTQANPFSTVYADIQNKTASKNSLLSLITDGYENLPALNDCFDFTAIENQSPNFLSNNIEVGFYIKAKPFMKTSDGKEESGSSYSDRYIYWTGSLAELEGKTISYTMYYPNAMGWYITAILAVALIVTGIYFGTKNSKQQPKLIKIEPRRAPVRHVKVSDIDVFGLNNENPNSVFNQPYESEAQKKERAKKELDEIFGTDDNNNNNNDSNSSF